MLLQIENACGASIVKVSALSRKSVCFLPARCGGAHFRHVTSRRACLIVNPAAGRGGARKDMPAIKRAFSAQGIDDIRLTERSGDEFGLASRAIREGMDTIVAVGGDGTVAKIAHAIVSEGSGCRLGLVPVGTGNDFAKTVGALGRGYDEIAALCAGQSVATVDVCKVDEWYFINSCGFGIDPAVLKQWTQTERRLD